MVKLLIIVGMLLQFGYVPVRLSPLFMAQKSTEYVIEPKSVDAIDEDEITHLIPIVAFIDTYEVEDVDEEYVVHIYEFIQVNEKDRHDDKFFTLIKEINLDMIVL